MSTNPSPNARRSRQLPPYRAVFAVDTKDFSAEPSAHQEQLSNDIPHLLSTALEQCGLARLWQTKTFGSSTGDGYFFGVDAVDTPFLVDPLLRELQDLLEAHDEIVRSRSRSLRLRLRVSIHIGPIPDSGLATPMNETHRLLDSKPVRAVLSDSDPDTTYLAAILSRRVFDDVILGDYAKLRPSQFARNAVEVKDFRDIAWLYTPSPSIDPERLRAIEGVSPVDPAEITLAQPAGESRPTRNTEVVHTFYGPNNQSPVISGGVSGDINYRELEG